MRAACTACFSLSSSLAQTLSDCVEDASTHAVAQQAANRLTASLAIEGGSSSTLPVSDIVRTYMCVCVPSSCHHRRLAIEAAAAAAENS